MAIASGCSLTLSQDASKGRQLARFWVADKSLVTHSGVFAMRLMPHGSSVSILETTKKMFAQFATRYAGAPERRRGDASLKPSTPPSLDIKLEAHCRAIVHVWNTDAAENEILAGKESARTCLPNGQEITPMFHNLRFINRDRAHASRRPGVQEGSNLFR
eukprot:8672977-Pyramimonas_sp.AAC.1